MNAVLIKINTVTPSGRNFIIVHILRGYCIASGINDFQGHVSLQSTLDPVNHGLFSYFFLGYRIYFGISSSILLMFNLLERGSLKILKN